MSGVHQRLLVERFNDRCALASTTLGSLSDIEGNPRVM
jgi:hypothetical protein